MNKPTTQKQALVLMTVLLVAFFAPPLFGQDNRTPTEGFCTMMKIDEAALGAMALAAGFSGAGIPLAFGLGLVTLGFGILTTWWGC